MKGKTLIVLFSLALMFGVLIASCDDGVLPNYQPDPYHYELELDQPPGYEYRVWGGATTIYQDFYQNDFTVELLGSRVGLGPGDGKVDVDAAGDEISMDRDAALLLLGTKSGDWTYTAVSFYGKPVLQLK